MERGQQGERGEMDRRAFLGVGVKAGAATAAGLIAGASVTDVARGRAGARVTTEARRATGDDAPGRPGPPTALTTAGLVSPVGADPDDVQFAWQVSDPRRGALQRAYRIWVRTLAPAGAGALAPTVWDSGVVESAQQSFVPYAGPALRADTAYQWVVATADADGRWSAPSAPTVFRTGLREEDWTAQWLRPGPPDPGEEEYTYLRTTVTVPGGAGSIAWATAYVAAAHKYQLWVNGARVDTGPSFCFPDQQYVQATDLTAVLRPGEPNAVGVLHHWYGPGRGRPTSAPGLLVQVTAHTVDGRQVSVPTDRSWRTRRAEWLPAPQRNNDSGDFVEWIDGRLHPAGWSEAGFDDSSWAPAAVRGPVGTAPFTALYPQRTRIVEHAVAPVAVWTLPSGSVVADFGKVYAGRPTVAFGHGVDGHTVPLHVGYTLDPDRSVSTTHNTQGTDLSFSYIQRAGAQTFDPYWYLGFRYLQVDDPGEPLGASQLALMARHAGMPEGPEATFTSSHPTLDAVWALCARSALYCSQEQFIDTPTREKGQFLWDAANESETVMRTFGDRNLTWQGLRDMARAQGRYWPASGQVNEIYPNDDGPQNYPTFTARYPEWVWRYYRSTGDTGTVVGLLPVLQRLSDWLVSTYEPATGLVSGQPMSTNGDSEYGYDYDTNADTTLNILAVNAFRRTGQIAALAGDPAGAQVQAARAAALTAAVNSLLVTGGGLYVDGLRADGTQSAVSSQLANLAALAYDVVPADQVATVAQFVASLDISVQPDHGMELLRALHAAGRDADVVRILTDASFPGWAYILDQGGTFTWETWTPSDLIGDSMSHGWGSSALVAIQEALLGATPATPAPDGRPTVVDIAVPSGGLAHAAGSFPSPAGQFAVSWRRTGAGTRLALTVPPNAAARCHFPGTDLSQVTEGGAPVTAGGPGVRVISATPGMAVVAAFAGTYDFEVAATAP